MAKKTKNVKYFEAIGRRKQSIARVRIYLASNREKTAEIKDKKYKAGEFFVNDKPLAQAFAVKSDRQYLLNPLEITANQDRFVVSAVTRGGGHSGQLDAIVLGLSRAIEAADKETYRKTLKMAGLLKRDPRKKERRKVGTGGKARRAKQSPKR